MKPKLRFPEFTDEWQVKKLGDISKMQAGKFISASKIQEDASDKLYPCYGGNGLRGYVESFNYEGKHSLIGRQGALCGNVKMVKGTFYATEHAVVVQPKNTDVDWLYLQLQRLDLNQYATGQAQPGLSVETLNSVFSITPPDLKEQKKIGDFLMVVGEKITVIDRNVEKIKAYKQGVMQALFSGKLRFKDENGNTYPDWEEKRIGEIGKVVGGGTPDTLNTKYWGNEIVWLTPTEVKAKYIYTSKRMITEEGFKNSSATLLPVGTVILTSRATVGDVAIAQVRLTTNQGFQSIIVNEDNDNHFIYYWAMSNRKVFLRKSSGSTFPEISKKEVEKIVILAPSKNEQKKIADFLTALDRRIEIEEARLAKAKEFKKSLLQRMFV